MRKHALLSASGATRWINCPPSARLEEQIPEQKSTFADEGTLAHNIAEVKARKKFIEQSSTKQLNAELKEFKEHELYDKEMLQHTDTYVDYISSVVYGFSTQPHIEFEQKIDFSDYVPEGFGTADCVIKWRKDLHVIDFKYGKGVYVGAENNSQMLLYALGTYNTYRLLYDIKNVHMTIVQPRLDNISTSTISTEELLKWGEYIKPLAQKAFNGEGEYKAGEHCRFCRAKALCRARSEFSMEIEPYTQITPPLLDVVEIGSLLSKAKEFGNWISDLEEYALSHCLKGGEIAGWKVVEGRSKRVFTDIDKAFEVLQQNSDIDETMLYKRVPITLSETEKLLGRNAFIEYLTPFVIKPQGKPTLVPDGDLREPIKLATTAKEDFSI